MEGVAKAGIGLMNIHGNLLLTINQNFSFQAPLKMPLPQTAGSRFKNMTPTFPRGFKNMTPTFPRGRVSGF